LLDYRRGDGNDFSGGNGRKVGEMREKYLKKLKDLIAEMQEDVREFSGQERALLSLLRVVLVAFWFHQADDLNNVFSAWRVGVNNPLLQDVARLIDSDLQAADEPKAGAWDKKIIPFSG